ncbi:MAG: efflux transporter periplasmic adaptor subunit [Sphingomonas sp.]|nr:efflux transporter periplasmic adaptor subunit [Sphingomonas sp.]
MIRRYSNSFTLPIALVLAGCGGNSPPPSEQSDAHEEAEPEGVLALSANQIEAAGIVLVTPQRGGSAGSINVPGTIAADPDGIRVVSATVGGRLVTLSRNLGEPVRRGDVLAVVESREAAELRGSVEAARARLALAESDLRREERLFAERVTPERDLIAARTAATEARIALRQAEQALGAAGSGAGSLNRIAIRSPISGRVIGRAATLGQSVPADGELYRVASLGELAVELSLTPADASRARVGLPVRVTAPGRVGTARIAYLSPALDAETRLVPVIASLDNGGGEWRVGETVQASVQLPGEPGTTSISVPLTAVQKVEGRNVVFVRTESGFRAQPVTLGERGDGRAIVTEGLSGNEQVAAGNSFTLKAELGKGAAEHGH